MSSQFPPSGYRAQNPENQGQDGQQVFGGYSGSGPYGSGANDYTPYTSGNQYAAQGDQHTWQGEQQHNNGGGQYRNEGQQFHGQQQYQPAPVAGKGNNNGGQPGQWPQHAPKKRFPGWGWAMVVVLAVALVGAGVWGGIALSSHSDNSSQSAVNSNDDSVPSPDGGGDGSGSLAESGSGYDIESDKTVSDVDVTYNGSWSEAGADTYVSDDYSCYYLATFEGGATGIDPDDVEGSVEESVADAVGQGSDIDFTKLNNVTIADTEGVGVEFVLYEIQPTTSEGIGYIAAHPFSDSGDMLMMAAVCQSSDGIDKMGFRGMMADTEFTLTPEDN